MAVTHIVSLLTEVAMVVAALMAAVAMAVEGSVAGFATGSGCDGRGCFRQGNGGSTSSIWVRGSTGRNNAPSLLCRTDQWDIS